jgi:DNA repair exonuclease SbcCD ATPase subunit
MEKHTISIDVNTRGAQADVDKLDKDLTKLDKTVEELASDIEQDLGAAISSMEDKMYALAAAGQKNSDEFKQLAAETGKLKQIIIETDMEVEFLAASSADVGQKIGLLEDRMYAMAVAGDTTSAEFRRIATEAAALKQQVTLVDMAIDGMAMTTTQKLSGALGGATGAFAAGQGAMAAFGTESEAVNQALLKVNAAMALVQGVQGIQEALPAMTALKNNVLGAFQSMTAAGKAFALTGIGLVVTALAAAPALLDAFTISSEEAEKAQKKLTKGFDDQSAAIDRNIKRLEKSIETEIAFAEAVGKSEKDIAAIRKKGTEDLIAETEKQIKIQQQKLLALSTPLDNSKARQEIKDALIKQNADEINETKNHLNRLKVENNARRIEMKLDSIKAKTEENEALKEKQREEAEAAAEAARQRAAQLAQERKDGIQKLKDAETAFSEEEKLRYMTDQQKEIYEVQKKYEELLAIATKYGYDKTQLLENQKNEENEINATYAAQDLEAQNAKDAALQAQIAANEEAARIAREEFDEEYRLANLTKDQLEIESVSAKYFSLITLAEQYGLDTTAIKARQEAEINEIDRKSKEEQMAREKQLRDQKVQAVQNGLSTIGSLAELFAGKSKASQKKAFNVQKGVQIAQATIDTYKAATGAYSSMASIPTVGPILGAVAAAAAVAAGLLNIKKISATKFDEGGGSAGASAGGASASMPSVTTPEFNIVGGNTANQLADLNAQPVQSYVVSSEVTTAQSLDRNRIQNATL